jgi:cellulose biosynthesis protein BcsQ
MLIVSFHSYKGGSGCTTTVINTLPFLIQELRADENHPILVIDGDLDSAGLTYLLGADQFFENAYDVKELLSGSLPGKNIRNQLDNHPFLSKCLPVGDKFGSNNNAVYFLGINDNRFFEANDMVGSAEKVLYELRRLCYQLGFKAIVFDSAPGEQFSSALVNRIAQVIVSCLKPTKQARLGTKRYLERLEPMMIDSDTKDQVHRLIILPTSVPQTDTIIKGKDQYTHTLKLMQDVIENLNYDVNKVFVTEERFGIPEIERFKWEEDILYNLNINEEEKQALTLFQTLAQEIVNEGKDE